MSRAPLLVSVFATASVIGWDSALPNEWHIISVIVACVAYAAIVAADRRWGGLTLGLVVWGAAAVVATTSSSASPRLVPCSWSSAADQRQAAAWQGSVPS